MGKYDYDSQRKTIKKEEYRGWIIEQYEYQQGEYCPGPRSPNEPYDYFVTRTACTIYNKNEKNSSPYSDVENTKLFVDQHLTVEGVAEREANTQVLSKLSEKISVRKKQIKELNDEVIALQREQRRWDRYLSGKDLKPTS